MSTPMLSQLTLVLALDTPWVRVAIMNLIVSLCTGTRTENDDEFQTNDENAPNKLRAQLVAKLGMPNGVTMPRCKISVRL